MSERNVEHIDGNPPRARRFLRAFAFWIVGGALSLTGASIYSNHYGAFGERGQFHTYNDRQAKSEHLVALPGSELADAWVIGSSNTMPFQPATVERLFGQRTFNLGSYWGRVEDLWCWLNFLTRDVDAQPQLVILGIEPWTFGADDTGPPFYRRYRRRLLTAPLLVQHLDRYDPALLRLSNVFDTLSIQSVKTLARTTLEYRGERVKQRALVDSIFEADGTSSKLNDPAGGEFLPEHVHRLYATREARGEDEHAALMDERHIRTGDVLAYLPGGRLDEASVALFRRTIALCQEQGIEVNVVLLPVHPHFYDYLVRDTAHAEHLDELRALLAELEADFPVLTTTLDASHIDRFGGDPFGFHDNFHMTPANADRVLERLARKREAAR